MKILFIDATGAGFASPIDVAARYVLDEWREEYNHRRPHGGLQWQTPAAYAAQLVDPKAGAFPVASRVESPVGAAPLPPTQHAN